MVKKIKELDLPHWIMDGFNGILALVIYDFLLYLSKIAGIKGIVGQMEEITGYFYLNIIIDFVSSKISRIVGVITVLLLAFLLGVGIANIVRKVKKKNSH